MHPLLRDLTKLTDSELHDKITGALNRMRYFGQMGNTAAYTQVTNIYWDYMNEQEERQVRKILADAASADGDEFEDLIKVNK